MGRLALRTEHSAAELDLEDGARLTSLRFHGLELLVPKEQREPLWWGSFVMAPWTGDLIDGAFRHEGRSYAVPRDPGPHASHGTVRMLPWTATSPGRARADLGAGWPFAGSVSLAAELDDTQLALRLRLDAADDMPAAIGFHPWFARQLTPAGGVVEVSLPPGGRMLVRRPDGTPTERFTRLGPPPWNETVRFRDPSAVLTWPGDGRLELTWSSEYATVFTAHPQGVCVEPVTSPSGRMDHTLRAGEALELTMTAHWIPWLSPGEPTIHQS